MMPEVSRPRLDLSPALLQIICMQMRIFWGVTMDPSHGEFILTRPDIKVSYMQVFANHSIVAAPFYFFQFCEVGRVANDRYKVILKQFFLPQ